MKMFSKLPLLTFVFDWPVRFFALVSNTLISSARVSKNLDVSNRKNRLNESYFVKDKHYNKTVF